MQTKSRHSCKSILAVMLDQGPAKKTQEKGHLCKPDGYIWKQNLELAGHGIGNRKEKGKRENWIKGIGTRIRIARTGEGYQVSLTLVPRTSHLTRRRSTRPPPRSLHTSTHAIKTPTVNAPRQDAVTSDTMGGWVLTQCAAAMRVTCVANGSSDSKAATTEHIMSSFPLSDSPFRSRSYVTFMTDQELQQAKADLEECFRRRARWAGLEDSLPANRPMTEEEIEDLQWQLGDFGPVNGYGSKGRKHNKDVIDMTI
jgi:hypothetical protein